MVLALQARNRCGMGACAPKPPHRPDREACGRGLGAGTTNGAQMWAMHWQRKLVNTITACTVLGGFSVDDIALAKTCPFMVPI